MNDEITINNLHRQELNTKLFDIINEVRRLFGRNRRLLVIIDDGKPNAYAGAYPSEDRLYLQRGLFEIIDLDKESDEIKFVISHEFSHISNGDFGWGIVPLLSWLFSPFIMQWFVERILSQNALIADVIGIFVFVVGALAYCRWRRKIELRCDTEAVTITKDFEAAKRYRRKISELISSMENTLKFRDNPGFFIKHILSQIYLGTHPSEKERMINIENLEKSVYCSD